ncbi:MAG TPA: hypothetical protein VFW28_09180 [Micropepsaceae bacterium]|nr:hypothetical protein [Micropepsaceae bacterium]
MAHLTNLVRRESDPKILKSGPGSLSPSDRLGRFLGWFSIALGAVELLAPRVITRALGMEGNERLVRAYGAREIGAGVASLSIERETGLYSRVAGDALDIATLVAFARPRQDRRGNLSAALLLVSGITLIDVLASAATTRRHPRSRSDGRRSYRDRSGFPQGIESARRAARLTASPAGTAPQWSGTAG